MLIVIHKKQANYGGL